MGKQLLILALLLLAAPALVGGLFRKTGQVGKNLLFCWVSGQFLLWASFQLVCVPLILREERFARVVQLYSGLMGAEVLLAAAIGLKRLIWGSQSRRKSGNICQQNDITGEYRSHASGLLLWALFWAVLLFQLIQAVRLSYGDTDDAFYVAISSITEKADTMYRNLPYTGGETELDARHGLAPFPVWIAFLARLSGMEAVTVAKVVLPVVSIAMAYAIFYLIGRKLFPEGGRRPALFLLFTQLLVLFGNTSIYTAENFLIARSRQGKAALGSLVIPFLLFLLLTLYGKLQEKSPVPFSLYLLFGAAAVTGCLCSTLGTMLMCLAIGIGGLLGAVCYRRFRVLLPMALCCAPCAAYAFLYLYFH